MNVRIVEIAMQHIIDGAWFYDEQEFGVGQYFINCIFSDIDRLSVIGGVHEIQPEGFYRMISRRFPYAIYYLIESEDVVVYAVLDCRRDPKWISRQLN